MVFWALTLTETLSDKLLPVTLRDFTASASVIGLVLAVNPAFGILVQPLFGVVSDHTRTRFGRRRVFLLLAAPAVSLSLILVPHASAFVQVVGLVVFYQFFQDVLWAALHPLMAGAVSPKWRTLNMSLGLAGQQVLIFAFLNVGIGWALPRMGQQAVYAAVAAAQILLIGPAFLLIREQEPAAPAPARPPFSLRRYLSDLLGDPVLRRFAALAFCQGVFRNIITGFIVLFAVQTLALPKSAFGEQWSLQSPLAVVLAVPLALGIERWMPKQIALTAGYAVALGAVLLGWRATGLADLAIIAVLFGLGHLVIETTQKPFFSEFIPSDILGQITGAYNICYASGRVSAFALGGALIGLLDNNYRAIWPVAAVFGVAAMLLAASLRDPRFAERRRLASSR